MNIHKHTTYTVDHDDKEFELVASPIDDPIFRKVKGGYIVGYLTQDETASYPPDDWDGCGKIGTSNTRDRHEMNDIYREALGLDHYWQRDEDRALDPDVVLLDVYEHSGRVYHVGYNANFPDRKFDCAYGGAVWVPDDVLRKEVEGLSPKARNAKMIEYAKQCVEVVNQWSSGDVYDIWIQKHDENGTLLNREVCGGYFGHKYAEDELASQVEAAKL